jgi:protein-disulfide isomerase-like protein with CxxC motif
VRDRRSSGISNVTVALGFNPLVFMAVFDEISSTSLGYHLEASRVLIDRHRFSSVPAFALEIDGAFDKLPFGHYLCRPRQFKEAIV